MMLENSTIQKHTDCLDQLSRMKTTVKEISDSLQCNDFNNSEEMHGEQQVERLVSKLSSLVVEIDTLEDICHLQNTNFENREDQSVDLVMQFEVDLPQKNKELETCDISQANIDYTAGSSKEGGPILNEMVNPCLLEESNNLIRLLLNYEAYNKALTIKAAELQSVYLSNAKEHSDLKLKFEKLKQLTIKSRQEERLAREQSNSERETYQLCVTQTNQKLSQLTDEIRMLKENNKNLIVFIEKLEEKMKEEEKASQEKLHNLSVDLSAKIKELEMSRQANEFLNDEHLNLKMALKSLQQQLQQLQQQPSEVVAELDRSPKEEESSAQFENAVKLLEKKLSDKEDTIFNLNKELDSKKEFYQDEINRINLALNQSKVQLVNMTKENISLKEQVKLLQDQKKDPVSYCSANHPAEDSIVQEEITPASPLKRSDFNLDTVLKSVGESAIVDDTASSTEVENRTFDSSLVSFQSLIDDKSKDYLEILAQSENTTTLLQRQISVLQKEIRRLERNQDRVETVKNLEQLKDMILKFIVTDSDDKKLTVPFLSKILVLNDSEVEVLNRFAELDIRFESNNQSSWYHYLKPW